MSLAAAVREHYLTRYPAEAARVVEKRHELLPEMGELSGEALSHLFEYLDPGYLKTFFTALDATRRRQVLQNASNRTGLLILGGLSREEMVFDKEKLLQIYDITIEKKPM